MRVGHMSPIAPTILPWGSQAHRKKTLGYTKPQIPFSFNPSSLSLSLLPGRLWHCNKFLATVHVPELNIGKVALTAITNMGWVPLFFPVPPSVCVGLYAHILQPCVSETMRRKNKITACVYLVCLWASVPAYQSRLTWACVCVCVCVWPSYETIISQHVSVWATSHGGYN